MHIFNVNIPEKPLANIELTTYAQELEIPHFICVFMRDTLPLYPVANISMHHDICYRDSDTLAGKHECDRKMLAELNALVPKGRREKVDKPGAKYHWIGTQIGTGYTLEQSTGE